ncbi:MAG: hypothetical protein N2Z72_02925 [Bacteroidales bacterium]|nr:hypothetical protein [Bacteroidales bacterium]
MKKFIIGGIFVIKAINFFSQVSINLSGSVPHSSAALDLDFPDKGLLIPRISLIQTNNPAPIQNPAEGLLIFNTSTINDVTKGFYYWDGNKWKRLFDHSGEFWNLHGNSGTTPANFIGTTDAQPFIIKTNNNLRAIIDIDGNVGIGTPTPGMMLDVAGPVRTETYTFRRVDLSNATTNYLLAVGEEAMINFTNTTTVPIRIAIPQNSFPIIYEILVCTYSAILNSNYHIYPNGLTYSNQFTGDRISTPAPGTPNGYIGHEGDINTWYSSSFSFDVGHFGGEVGPCFMKLYLFYYGATRKKIMASLNGCTDYGFNVSQSVWNNTTTPWTEIGHFVAPQNNISGFILVKRIN